MALYSWFSRTETELNSKKNSGYNKLTKPSESVKYIENYTMWPTAKIKSDIKVILPSFNGLDNELAEQKKTLLPTKTALTAIKS